MESNPVKPIDLMNVSLLTPIDPYKLSDRATKYGILFVVLTFGGFFLFEMMKRVLENTRILDCFCDWHEFSLRHYIMKII